MKKLLLSFCAASVLLIGCSSDKDPDPPAELVDIKPRLRLQKLWSEGLGGKSDRLRLALRTSVVDGVAYAAAYDGDVIAVTADKGKRLWRAKTDLPLSAGPGVGEGLVVVGSSNGDLLALDAKTGKEVWRHALSSEVLATPLVANGLVVVRTVDGRLQALTAGNAEVRWSVEEDVPRLSLRGTATPVLSGNSVIAGFDNGKVMSVDLNTGETQWDTLVSAPRGRTELERLVDIDAVPRVSGDDLFVVGFQGRAAMLALDSGQIWWAQDVSSYRGFGMDDSTLYVSSAEGHVLALRRTDGSEQWQQAALHRRALTAPAVDGDSLVVGDFEGYVHWLDKQSGEIIARAKTDGERITNAPVAADGRVFVQTDGGTLIAFQAKPRE